MFKSRQRVTREYPIVHDQTHRIARVARRIQHLQSQLPDRQHFAVVQTQIHERGRTRAVHHDRDTELSGELVCGGEVIGVGVGIDEIPDAQTVPRRQCEVGVNVADLGIDQRGNRRFIATHQIRLTAP
jgi:hypothetical protein